MAKTTPASLQFVAGMPRAGTTLFMNLLGQNPAHHVTPTSGVVHLFLNMMDRWVNCAEFRAEGLHLVKPRMMSAIRGMMHGFYEEPLSESKIVFDKSRAWLDHIEILESVLQREVRVIAMVRDVRAIVASFEKIYRRRGIEHRVKRGNKHPLSLSVEDRAKRTLDKDNLTGRSITRFRDAMDRCQNRVIIIPYNKFTQDPQSVMDQVHEALDLPPFQYDPANVEQLTFEDDNFVGMDLHQIRSKIEPQASSEWEGILPPHIAKDVAEKYSDLTQLAEGDVIVP